MTNRIRAPIHSCRVVLYSFWWLAYRDTNPVLQSSVLSILMTNHIRTPFNSYRVVFCSFWWLTISGHSSIMHSSVCSFGWPPISGHSSILAEKSSIHPDGQPYRGTHPLRSSVLFIIALLWKTGVYTRFALSFLHSVIPSFRNLSNEKFRHTFLRNCEA